jgi:hypothetical protein
MALDAVQRGVRLQDIRDDIFYAALLRKATATVILPTVLEG